MRYAEWMQLAEDEYARLLELVSSFEAEDWQRPTDCDGWSVRALVSHLAGAAAASASPRETIRQMRLGRRLKQDGVLVDGMNAVQVRERSDTASADLVTELRHAAQRGVVARRRLPAAVRAVPLPFGEPLGTRSLGYLMGRIYTRDAWMHRVDLARATGRQLILTSDHDAAIVRDVVLEWSAEHGQAFDLTLTGPAGGEFEQGDGGHRLKVDAVEFCRALSGRAVGTGLLQHEVPF